MAEAWGISQTTAGTEEGGVLYTLINKDCTGFFIHCTSITVGKAITEYEIAAVHLHIMVSTVQVDVIISFPMALMVKSDFHYMVLGGCRRR